MDRRVRPGGYAPLLELYLRRKLEGGNLRVPGEFHGMLDAIGRRECLVLIHGFNNSEGEAAVAYFGFRARQSEIFERPDANYFDPRFGDAFWPGDADFSLFFDKVDFLIYPSAVHTAVKAGEQLASLLLRMPSLERVDFVAHSLGCRVALETVKNIRARSTVVIGRLSLMAAAVPSEMLEPGGRYNAVLVALSAQRTLIQILYSKQDEVLHLAFPFGQALAGTGEGSTRALGRFGPTPSMPGYGATLTEREIQGAAHGDYWGDARTNASKRATEEAGRFLEIGEIGRDLGVARGLGTVRALGVSRQI